MGQRRYFSIFVTGSFSSGKSSLIKSISHSSGSILQPELGYSMCCGRINLDDEDTILLYEIRHPFHDARGVPGTPLGWIVVVNSAVPTTFRESRSLLVTAQAYSPLPVVIAANPHHLSLLSGEPWTLDELQIALNLPEDVPVIECNTREREPVKQALIALLESSAKPSDEGEPSDTDVDFSNPFNAQPPLILENDVFFRSNITHHYVAVVSTLWLFNAHRFMMSLANQFVWLSLDDSAIPRYHGYYEIDPAQYLHVIPFEQFGYPENPIISMLEDWVATSIGQSTHEPVINDKLDLSGATGCIGLFDSADKHSMKRIQQLIRIVGNVPCVLVDVRSPAATTQEDTTGLNKPIIKTYDTFHRIIADQVMRELCQLLAPDIAALLLPAFSQ